MAEIEYPERLGNVWTEEGLAFEEDLYEDYKIGFINGFKTEQSLNDKMFSLEDMKKLMHESIKFSEENQHLSIGEYAIKHYDWWNTKIRSLQQTEWNVEVEMDCGEVRQCECADNTQCLRLEPKITNNSIRIVKIL